jgi:hypothetical protein
MGQNFREFPSITYRIIIELYRLLVFILSIERRTI